MAIHNNTTKKTVCVTYTGKKILLSHLAEFENLTEIKKKKKT